jgi:hypothetical protein
MYTIKCPDCGKKVKLIPFGFAWVGACWHGIIYNSRKLPDEYEERDEGRMFRPGKAESVKEVEYG